MAAGEAVFHPGALLNLAAQLQCTAIPRSYALTFLEMLQTRVDRILSAIGNNNVEAAMDAILSLKVNSHMVGGLAMEQACCTLERHLRNGKPTAAALADSTLAAHGAALAQALTGYLRMT
jgi:HPt (histidine-containing phosphotransfer) domain-containing protein